MVLLACALISALLGLVAARSYLVWHNTLANNGGWVSTKTTLARGLLGAYSFINGRQTLAGGTLHLDAWHGHNEVIHRRPLVEPVSLEFEVRLGNEAYVVAFFDRRDEEDSAGLRLSARPGLPGGLLTVTPEGRFTSFAALQRPSLEPGVWHRVRLELAADAVEVLVDGRPLGRYPRHRPPRQRFGFRSGFARVEIDNVVARQADGRRLRESFDRPHGAGWVLAAAVLLPVLVNIGLYRLLRRQDDGDMELGFRLLMVNGTLLVVGALVLVFVLLRADRYLFSADRLAEEEAYFQKGATERVVAEVRGRYPRRAPEGVYRIVFIGGSQTWGAGAQRDEEVFVPVLESMLNAAGGGEPRFECVNGGISATRAWHQFGLLRKEWLKLAPRLVVINMSSNDKPTKDFAGILARMVERIHAAGAQVLLVQEANSTEKWVKQLRVRHRDMQEVAERLDLPIVDMHAYLESQAHTGFLWWDFVHLTSYGQRLVAERLVEEIRAIVATGSG